MAKDPHIKDSNDNEGEKGNNARGKIPLGCSRTRAAAPRGFTLIEILGIIITAAVTIAMALITILFPILFKQLSDEVKTVGEGVSSTINEMSERLGDTHRTITSNNEAHTAQLAKNTDAVVDLTRYIDTRFHRNELRLIRIETVGELLVPYTVESPMRLSEFGISLLKESGMEVMILNHKSALIKLARDQDPNSIPEADEVAKSVIDEFKWSEVCDPDPVENYMDNHPIGRMFDIYEIGAVYFRDILMEELGMEYPTKDERTASPPQIK